MMYSSSLLPKRMFGEKRFFNGQGFFRQGFFLFSLFATKASSFWNRLLGKKANDGWQLVQQTSRTQAMRTTSHKAKMQ